MTPPLVPIIRLPHELAGLFREVTQIVGTGRFFLSVTVAGNTNAVKAERTDVGEEFFSDGSPFFNIHRSQLSG